MVSDANRQRYDENDGNAAAAAANSSYTAHPYSSCSTMMMMKLFGYTAARKVGDAYSNDGNDDENDVTFESNHDLNLGDNDNESGFGNQRDDVESVGNTVKESAERKGSVGTEDEGIRLASSITTNVNASRNNNVTSAANALTSFGNNTVTGKSPSAPPALQQVEMKRRDEMIAAEQQEDDSSDESSDDENFKPKSKKAKAAKPQSPSTEQSLVVSAIAQAKPATLQSMRVTRSASAQRSVSAQLSATSSEQSLSPSSEQSLVVSIGGLTSTGHTTRTRSSKLSIIQFSINSTETAALVKGLTPNQHFTFSLSGYIDNDNDRMIFEESNDVQHGGKNAITAEQFLQACRVGPSGLAALVDKSRASGRHGSSSNDHLGSILDLRNHLTQIGKDGKMVGTGNGRCIMD